MHNKARTFAIKAHAQQQYGEHPYIVHLDAVAHLAAAFGEQAVIIAYLHDVIEDTAVSRQEIEQHFGTFIADCVTIVTDEIGVNRKERKIKTYQKMAQVFGAKELALVVKICDRIANVQACIYDQKLELLKTYKEEQCQFKNSLYRQGLCDTLWQELENLIFNHENN